MEAYEVVIRKNRKRDNGDFTELYLNLDTAKRIAEDLSWVYDIKCECWDPIIHGGSSLVWWRYGKCDGDEIDVEIIKHKLIQD